MTVEAWSEIPELEYSVSDEGRIASRRNGGWKILKPWRNSEGYTFIHLTHKPPRKRARVHLLVAEAFLPDRPTPHHEINHKDGDKTNNRADNLEWVTHSENVKHILRLRGKSCGDGPPLRDDDIRSIRALRYQGYTRSEVAKLFGMSPSNVTMIARRKTWAHVA